MLAPLAFVLVLSFGINRLSLFASQAIFWTFAAAMGLSLSSIFVVYTGSSIARVFFITAASFGALSLYGYTTKRDLSGWGSFLIMGVIGILIAGILNPTSTQADITNRVFVEFEGGAVQFTDTASLPNPAAIHRHPI